MTEIIPTLDHETVSSLSNDFIIAVSNDKPFADRG
jgi:hypothetical protein